MAGAGLGFAATISIPASTNVDIIPPAGETWMITDWTGAFGAVFTKVGAAGASQGTYGASEAYAKVVITNATYGRMGGASSTHIASYGGVKI
jgi:hypothetical protein